MIILSPRYLSILSPNPEIPIPEISDQYQHTFCRERIQTNPLNQNEPDNSIRRQLNYLKIGVQERLIETTNHPRDFLSSDGIVAERQKSRSRLGIISKSESDKDHRLTGPIQFILKLLYCWKLKREDAIKLLGFEEAQSELVFRVLDGNEILHGRDAKDRLSHLFSIRSSLHDFFRNLKAENEWLREPQPLLDGQTPMTLLLQGPMEDILLVREYVDTMVGK